eukprot:CAMPEP_0177641318 /NCGR_PEP_ID=MMETSP0447-20121125/7001_1 /TAXON_ID=0 /ORGANISM="Stygamoeba regulata, Strain BSH-02190019" /LENGTH=47 /DNA_ID= /DNA_START= /DNA_END= /DNA_ORIENTATION=
MSDVGVSDGVRRMEEEGASLLRKDAPSRRNEMDREEMKKKYAKNDVV